MSNATSCDRPHTESLAFLDKTLTEQSADRFVIKTGIESVIQREASYLRIFANQPRLRRLVDTVGTDIIVLEHVDADLRSVSLSRRLTSREIKIVARYALEGLESMHAHGVVHTGQTISKIYPSRVLIRSCRY